jgi:hypothetical protein
VTAGTDAIAGRLRIVLGLARAEGLLLARSLLILAGVVGGCALVWGFNHATPPMWWDAVWEIGTGQVIVAMAVLVAAHLAAGRVRRNAVQDLYDSFPASAGLRTAGHLTALAGALPASLLLIGVTVGLDFRGAVGTPSVAALVGGVLLVIAGGATGVAIGIRFPHPLAGVLAALALFILFTQAQRFSGGVVWLFPWAQVDGLHGLPGPLTGYPPAAAHSAELAGFAVLAGAIAIALTARRGRPLIALALAGGLALTVICVAGAAQLRPIPAAQLNHLVTETADPASAEHCAAVGKVRYCLYPAFGSDLPAVQAPVDAVLARVPDLPADPLTIMQLVSLSLADTTLTRGQPRQRLAAWGSELARMPGNAAAPSAIYLTVGSWPGGAQAADGRFALALSTADWAVGLPATAGSQNGPGPELCVPVDQAREAIAIWLAMEATHLPLSGPASSGVSAVGVDNVTVPTWNAPGAGLISPGPQTTYVGYELAAAMARRSVGQVSRVLAGSWVRWLNWHTTDAQLASAVGIPMPTVPARMRAAFAGPPPTPGSPLCSG